MIGEPPEPLVPNGLARQQCLDAPMQLVWKALEASGRQLAGRRRNAAQSWAAVRGVWAFLRHELVRFWRA